MKNKIYLISQDLDFTPPDKIEFEHADWVTQVEMSAVHELKDDCSYLSIRGSSFEFTDRELSYLRNKLYNERIGALSQALPDFKQVAEIAQPTKGYMFKYEHGPIIDVVTFILGIIESDKVYYIVRCYEYAKLQREVPPQVRLLDYLINKAERLSDIISRIPEQDVCFMLDKFEKAEKERLDENTQSSTY